MDRRREWHDSQTLPASMVPRDMLADGSYRSFGYYCRKCSWRTDKVGQSGRQAVRAHSRVHAYDLRSWQRPLAAVILLLVVAAILAVGGHFGVVRMDALAEIPVPREVRLAFLGAPLAVAAGVAAAMIIGWNEISPAIVWTLRGVVVVSLVPVAGVVAAKIGIIGMDVGSVEIGLAAASSVVMAAFSCAAGYIRLLLRRRMRDPSGYTELVTARDDDAESELLYRAREVQRKATKHAAAQKKAAAGAGRRDGPPHGNERRDDQRSHGHSANNSRGTRK